MITLEVTGVWWLPENPKETVGGTLTFDDNEGAVLKLIGALGGIKGLQEHYETSIIHGVGDKQIVTLYKVQSKGLNITYPGINKQSLIASQVFTGAHLSEKDLCFNRVDIGLEYLPEFCNRSSLTSTLGHDESGDWTGLKAEVATQKPFEIGPVKGGQASIRFGWRQSTEPFRSLTLIESCSLTVEFKKTHRLSELLEQYVSPLQDLVTMGTDKPNAITSLKFKNTKILDQRAMPVTIELFQRSVVAPRRKPKDSLTRPHMLFTLGDLTSGQVKRWLKIAGYYRPVVGIIFGQRYSKDIYVENRLLNAVSAVEAYHRRRFTNTVLDKKAWKAKKKRIVGNADSADVDFLNDALQYTNEKRLKARLDEVLKHSGLTKDLVTDSAEWNNQIRGYRNVLTHYDPDSPQEIKNYEPLYWLAESLSWVLLACLMVEMGFRKRTVLTLVKENQRYLFARNRVHELLKSGLHS